MARSRSQMSLSNSQVRSVSSNKSNKQPSIVLNKITTNSNNFVPVYRGLRRLSYEGIEREIKARQINQQTIIPVIQNLKMEVPKQQPETQAKASNLDNSSQMSSTQIDKISRLRQKVKKQETNYLQSVKKQETNQFAMLLSNENMESSES